MHIKISGIVITYNEEENIRRCIESMTNIVDEVIVLDSYSDDRTVEIAKSLGAKVFFHPFSSYADQKKRAIYHASYDQVLVLDADESLSAELESQISELRNNWKADGYFLDRISSIGTTWIKHGSWYPDFKLRLFDRRKIIIKDIHGHDGISLCDNYVSKKLRGYLYHHTNKDVYDRILTINNLSTKACQSGIAQGKRSSVIRMVLKPFFRFIIDYFIKLGFLDGFYGYIVAKTSAQYVFMREAKILEHFVIHHSLKIQ